MAIARLSVGVGSKGRASAHAQYIAREGKYEKTSDDLEKLEFTGHGNMPKWAEREPNFFWKMADEHERKNGSTYREHVIALPRELTPDQRHDLILDWIEQEIGDKHAYQYAIHNPPAMDGDEQPHCHLMFSERTIDGIQRDPEQYFKRYNAKKPDRGGAKKANTGIKPTDRRADLLAQRARWEKTCNIHLERAGSNARISMQSLHAQGIDREPMNFTMVQIQREDVKEQYKTMLEAREIEGKLNQLALKYMDAINIGAELERQRIEIVDIDSYYAEVGLAAAKSNAHAKEYLRRPQPVPQPVNDEKDFLNIDVDEILALAKESTRLSRPQPIPQPVDDEKILFIETLITRYRVNDDDAELIAEQYAQKDFVLELVGLKERYKINESVAVNMATDLAKKRQEQEQEQEQEQAEPVQSLEQQRPEQRATPQNIDQPAVRRVRRKP